MILTLCRVVHLRFVEPTPASRIVEAVTFVSDDPAFAGEMRMTIAFAAVPSRTRASMSFAGLPPRLRAEDNAEGTRVGLGQLALYLAG